MNQINRMLYRMANLSDAKMFINNLTYSRYSILQSSFYYNDLSTLVAQTTLGLE